MRICWSSDSSTGITEGNHLANRDWAGHKFDIVDVDMMDKGMGAIEKILQRTSGMRLRLCGRTISEKSGKPNGGCKKLWSSQKLDLKNTGECKSTRSKKVRMRSPLQTPLRYTSLDPP